MTSSIRRIPADPATLFAFEVDGKIRKADIEAMAQIVERGFDTFETIDMLVLFVRYDGIELGAVFDGANAKAQLRANRHVRRYAVVGAPTWAEKMIDVGDLFTPVDARTFEMRDVDAAWRWAAGR